MTIRRRNCLYEGLNEPISSFHIIINGFIDFQLIFFKENMFVIPVFSLCRQNKLSLIFHKAHQFSAHVSLFFVLITL